EGRAFYLLVFSLENGAYCQQILYSFKGLIFFRAKTGANTELTKNKPINNFFIYFTSFPSLYVTCSITFPFSS
ncbi:hypothetical protein ACW0S0_01080, partial [Fusobacterium polymorphum]